MATELEPLRFPETGFLRLAQILQFVPVSAATWWGWIKKGQAPEGIKVSHRLTVWRAEDVRAFIEKMGARKAA